MLPHNIVLAVFSCLLAQGNVVQALPARAHQTRSEYLGRSVRRDLDAVTQPRSLNPTNNAVLETRGDVPPPAFFAIVGPLGVTGIVLLGLGILKMHWNTKYKAVMDPVKKVTDPVKNAAKTVTDPARDAAKKVCDKVRVWITNNKKPNELALKQFDTESRNDPVELAERLRQLAESAQQSSSGSADSQPMMTGALLQPPKSSPEGVKDKTTNHNSVNSLVAVPEAAYINPEFGSTENVK